MGMMNNPYYAPNPWAEAINGFRSGYQDRRQRNLVDQEMAMRQQEAEQVRQLNALKMQQEQDEQETNNETRFNFMNLPSQVNSDEMTIQGYTDQGSSDPRAVNDIARGVRPQGFMGDIKQPGVDDMISTLMKTRPEAAVPLAVQNSNSVLDFIASQQKQERTDTAGLREFLSFYPEYKDNLTSPAARAKYVEFVASKQRQSFYPFPGYQTSEGQPLVIDSRTGATKPTQPSGPGGTVIPIQPKPSEADIKEARNYTTGNAVIDELEAIFQETDKLLPDNTKERLLQWPKRTVDVFMQRNPKLAIAKSMSEGFLAKFSKSLAGEVGVLTEQDIDRARELAPNINDTSAVRAYKFKALRGFVNEIYARGKRQQNPLGSAGQTNLPAFDVKIPKGIDPQKAAESMASTNRVIVKTGTDQKTGKKVIQYSNGDREYAQ